jgi:hypothetical protein
LSRIALIVLAAGIVCLLVAPYLFTRPGNISFKETGPIGDTIGGITAPITGLIGSILVFLALRAQIVANEIIQGQIRDQKIEEQMKKEVGYISDLYKYLLSTIENIQVGKTKGVGAIMELMNISVNWERKNAHADYYLSQGRIAELYGLLRLAKTFLIQVEKSKLDNSDKGYFRELVRHHVDSFVSPYLSMESSKPACEICGDMHNGVSFKLVELVREIEKLL